MGNPFSSPSTDAGRTEDREESGRWPFASHDDSDRRPTADLYSDASSSASELPGFPRISDDKDNGGRRSPVTYFYKTKNSTFWPPRRRVKSEPHQTWHGDIGPRARSCTSKTFPGPTHSFAARGRRKFGGNPIPQLKNPLTPY